MADIVISKGTYSVDINADEVNEELSNKLITLTLARTSTNQASGSKDTKIIDLLRVTKQIIIRGYITASATRTAKQVKDDLKAIVNGAGIAGGDVSLTYAGDTYTGYLEKVNFKEESSDNPSSEGQDQVKYTVTINFVLGTSSLSS